MKMSSAKWSSWNLTVNTTTVTQLVYSTSRYLTRWCEPRASRLSRTYSANSFNRLKTRVITLKRHHQSQLRLETGSQIRYMRPLCSNCSWRPSSRVSSPLRSQFLQKARMLMWVSLRPWSRRLSSVMTKRQLLTSWRSTLSNLGDPNSSSLCKTLGSHQASCKRKILSCQTMRLPNTLTPCLLVTSHNTPLILSTGATNVKDPSGRTKTKSATLVNSVFQSSMSPMKKTMRFHQSDPSLNSNQSMIEIMKN